MTKRSPSHPARARANLACIAEALDCSVEALLTGEELPVELAQAGELFSLWFSLDTDAQRDRLLRAVREAVGRGER